MKKAASLLNDSRHIKLIPLAGLMHIPYVVVFALLGQFKSFNWAGTKS